MPGFACHRLVETSFPPPPPSPASLSGEVWRRETETEGEKSETVPLQFPLLPPPPPPPQRTRCAVHEEEEETLRRLRFLFSYMIPLRLIWDRTLLTSFAAKYRTGKADWIAFAGGTTGHDEHLSYRDIIQTNA